jgi:hypothetical protein
LDDTGHKVSSCDITERQACHLEKPHLHNIKRGTTTAKEVESITRQLGYLGMAIPFVHHFLSRLGNLHTRAKIRRSIPINDECCKDLELMLHIIKIAHDGISMNIIVFRQQTHIYCSDLCPAGLRGYSNSSFA